MSKVRKYITGAMGFALIGTMMAGCATTKSVEQKIAEAQAQTDKKIESVSTQVEDLQEKQKSTDVRLDQLSQNAADALKRAEEAGVLAKGKFVFQQTFAEDRVHFKLDSYDIAGDAKAALDEFAQKVKDLNRPVYLEIQGFTDSQGGAKYNDMLGQQRAESVRRYLSHDHQFPLGRMSTVSYGETLPVASNKTKAGRAQNRRVVVVVLE